jgi:hypothetical protein
MMIGDAARLAALRRRVRRHTTAKSRPNKNHLKEETPQGEAQFLGSDMELGLASNYPKHTDRIGL